MLLVLALLLAPSAQAVAPTPSAVSVAPTSLAQSTFDDAAREFGVPAPLLLAIGWEASHWSADVVSRWGGYGIFDLREGDRDPSLEHAARLLEVDPNRVAREWPLSVRGAAAILADQARAANDGVLPAVTDLERWEDAVRAFSGREEPFLQDLYVRSIYEIVGHGASADTVGGRLTLVPRNVAWPRLSFAPPRPPAADSPLVDNEVPACPDNYTNDSRTGGDIDMVVIHTVQGGYSSCYNWFANCDAQASAHYVVRSSDGAVTQMVAEADIAHHAGNWSVNERSVGIEHEGYVSDPGRWYTSAMYAGSAALVVDIAARQGVPLDRSHVIGHDEVPDPYEPGRYGGSGNHTDPGSGWDWDVFMDTINGVTGVADGELVGVVADQDIYNGPKLVGATVWLAETGATTTVGDDGMYRFTELPFGAYTVHAAYPGFVEGTCAKTTSSSQDWCSIALVPDTTGSDTATDTATDEIDTGIEALDPAPSAALPGQAARFSNGCGCAHGSGLDAGAWGVAVGALGFLRARRRSRP